MKRAWLLSLLLPLFDASAGQKAPAPGFPAANEDFSEAEGVLLTPKDPWKEVEVRCGFLAVEKDAREPFSFHAYRIGRPCMIARPYLETDRRRDAAAGWDLCAFNNGGEKEPLELFAKKVLKPNIGKFVCFQGAHEGLGQFRVYRYVKLSEYHEH